MELKAGDRVMIPFHQPTMLNPNPDPVEAELIVFHPNPIDYDDGKGGTFRIGPRWDAKVIAPGKGIHHWLVSVDTMCIRPK